MNKFEEELFALKQYKYNKRLLSKDASIYFFLKNSKDFVKDYNMPDKCIVPDNLEEIANELFSLDNVYVALAPCEDYFDKEGEYVAEFPTRSYARLGSRDIIGIVKDFLGQGAIVYMYTYYCLITDIGDDKDVKTYWCRILPKIEEK